MDIASISIASWNIRGYSLRDESSRVFRDDNIHSVDYDILALCETFLRDDQVIELDNYKWIGHNRLHLAQNAARGSGGVGLLVKAKLLEMFTCTVIDKTFEGILWTKFKHKLDDDIQFNMCACYLPPESSSRGDSQQEFFTTLLSQIYMYNNGIPYWILGDFNKRIGDRQDVDFNIDPDIPQRVCIDSVFRGGEMFMDFLKDSRTCVLNGRFDPNNDNYTCITNRGQSVVDYICSPYDYLKYVSDFEVKLVNETINICGIAPIEQRKQPDHSIIAGRVNLSVFETISRSPIFSEANNDHYRSFTNVTGQCRRKYNVRGTLHEGLLLGNMCREALIRCVDQLIALRATQNELDEIYEEFTNIVHGEMDKYMTFVDVQPRLKKRSKRRNKPFWNSELQELWNNLCVIERSRRRNKRDNHLMIQFNNARRQFDKTYRKVERNYYKEEQNKLVDLELNNPREFWDYIKKLGPQLAREACENNVPDIEQWENHYSRLFKCDDDIIFNENIHDNNNVCDPYLNQPITAEEVTRVIIKAKPRKACGVDNIPNEILKLGRTTEILLALFNACFQHHMIPSEWNRIVIRPIPKSGKDPGSQ